MNQMNTMQRRLLAFFIFVFLALPAPALPGSADLGKAGLGGYDPVAYFEKGKPVRGVEGNIVQFKGSIYSFASDKNKMLFEADPAKYLPAYGGYCAYAMALGKKYPADPEVWKLVDGKLYLNYSKSVQRQWVKDIPGFIKKGDANWARFMNKAKSDQ
jgi:hypothetical protein